MENSHHSEEVHTFGCAFKQRGAECDCGGWVTADWPDSRPLWCGTFATEIGRAMSRGFDYRLLVEGIHDDEEES